MADDIELKAWVVTLNFGEGGPLATNIWLAPDEASAAALHTIDVLRRSKTENALVGCRIGEISADHLRLLLRGVEGKIPEGGKAPVVRLVPELPAVSPNEQAARDIQDRNRGHDFDPRQHLGGLFGGMGQPARAQDAELLRTAPHEAVPVADLSWARPWTVAEYYGPPMPDHLPPVA